MSARRIATAAAISVALIASLTACFGLPSIPTGGGGGGGTSQSPTDESNLTGTNWSGVDSDGDSWGFEFQSDGTVGLTFNGNSWDDATDTWTVAGGTLTISIAFNDGEAVLVGPVGDGESPINLNGSQGAATWTLTIDKD